MPPRRTDLYAFGSLSGRLHPARADLSLSIDHSARLRTLDRFSIPVRLGLDAAVGAQGHEGDFVALHGESGGQVLGVEVDRAEVQVEDAVAFAAVEVVVVPQRGPLVAHAAVGK